MHIWNFAPLQRRLKIRINYKSGNHMEFWVYYLYTTRKGSDITALQWVSFNSNKPVVMGRDNIESVWIVKTFGLFPMPVSMEPETI